MSIEMAQITVGVVEAYAAVGVIFAFVFLARPVTRLDAGVAGAPIAMRALILPGIAALWPFFVWRWIHGFPPVMERTPHRVRAATAGSTGTPQRIAGAAR